MRSHGHVVSDAAEVYLSPFPANQKEAAMIIADQKMKIPFLHLNFDHLFFCLTVSTPEKRGEMKRMIDRERWIQCRALELVEGGGAREEEMTGWES